MAVGAIGALKAMSVLDFDKVEARNHAWQVALEGHAAVRHVVDWVRSSPWSWTTPTLCKGRSCWPRRTKATGCCCFGS